MSLMVPTEFPPPPWSGFEIGPLNIRAYALCILLGIVVAMWLTIRRWKARGGPDGAVWDIAIWAIPFGIIGGRLYHVFSSPDAYFGPNGDPAKIIEIWNGGLGIWGAVALGAVGAWIGCRQAGVKLSAFADAAAPGVLIAQAIGRWGNWFNQELFGGPTDLPWGLRVDPASGNFPAGYQPDTLFHPTFLYESIWNLLGALAILALDKRFRLDGGRTFWLYATIYTFGRLWIEMIRIDEAEQVTLFGITTRINVWVSIVVFLASLAIFVWLCVRARKHPDYSIWLPGREPQPETEDAQMNDGDARHSAESSVGTGVTASQKVDKSDPTS